MKWTETFPSAIQCAIVGPELDLERSPVCMSAKANARLREQIRMDNLGPGRVKILVAG